MDQKAHRKLSKNMINNDTKLVPEVDARERSAAIGEWLWDPSKTSHFAKVLQMYCEFILFSTRWLLAPSGGR